MEDSTFPGCQTHAEGASATRRRPEDTRPACTLRTAEAPKMVPLSTVFPHSISQVPVNGPPVTPGALTKHLPFTAAAKPSTCLRPCSGYKKASGGGGGGARPAAKADGGAWGGARLAGGATATPY